MPFISSIKQFSILVTVKSTVSKCLQIFFFANFQIYNVWALQCLLQKDAFALSSTSLQPINCCKVIKTSKKRRWNPFRHSFFASFLSMCIKSWNVFTTLLHCILFHFWFWEFVCCFCWIELASLFLSLCASTSKGFFFRDIFLLAKIVEFQGWKLSRGYAHG